MEAINFKDWLLSQESTPASRAFRMAVLGLMPPTEIVRHGIGGHRTEPLAAMAFKMVKIASDPNTLVDDDPPKKRKKKSTKGK